MRGCGMMGRFMATTLSDLFLRVVLAMLFSSWLGVNGIWLSWPVGWFVGTVLSMVFYRTSIYRQTEEKRRCNFFDMGESPSFHDETK